jgi:hypothetical protein
LAIRSEIQAILTLCQPSGQYSVGWQHGFISFMLAMTDKSDGNNEFDFQLQPRTGDAAASGHGNRP